MKKIIIAIIAVFCGVSATYSQDASGATSGSKVMSVAEANRLNGVAQPTINGKPYSQYKAEQDALKQQKAAAANRQVVSNASTEKTMTVSDNPTPAKPVPVVDASITAKKVDAVTKPLPEVPEQFKLAVGQTWNATAAPQKMGETTTLQAGIKLETPVVATESKPTESKTEPVATPNSPNAAKTKTN